MATKTISGASSDEYNQLQLSSANGPVFRRIKLAPLRDARPDEIPVIDISGIFSTSLADRQVVADQIHAASTTSGFFYIKNHGIPASTIEAAHQASLEFFRQPEETKQRVNSNISTTFNGWRPPQTQRLNATESIDARESFSFTYNPTYDPAVTGGLESIPAEIRHRLNLDEFCWEQTRNLPLLKTALIAHWRACLSLAHKLTRSFALALSLPENSFDAKTSHPDANLAVNYYPTLDVASRTSSCSSAQEQEQVSIGSHTDFQLFTILWQDRSGGLQVLNREGEWISAVPIEGTFVVNIGDYLQRITNDRYVSTVHRAKNLSGRERVSMPLFFGFNLNETCGVLESCVDEEHPARYEGVSCEEWVRLRMREMLKTS